LIKDILARKECISTCGKRGNARRRKIVLVHYGSRCACCGEDEEGFLTIDHIDGIVPEMAVVGRKLGGVNLYKYLIKYNFPPGYQCLCSNCNMAIGWWGICPHKRKLLSLCSRMEVRADARLLNIPVDIISLKNVAY